MFCRLKRLITPPVIDAKWDKMPWKAIPSERIQNYMGKMPKHWPDTQVKIAYDDTAIYLIFRVKDQYVRAVADGYQSSVCKDSCVEFFFTPGEDLSNGYFNFEMNCGGTTLFAFHPATGNDVVGIPESEYKKIRIAHSLPEIVEPEIETPVTWTVEYGIPFDILKKYCTVTDSKPGVSWRANFYKCADHTSHPHWLTWSPIDFPTPKFHLPEFFGVLEFG